MMSVGIAIGLIVAALAIGAAGGFFVRRALVEKKNAAARTEAEAILLDAQKKSAGSGAEQNARWAILVGDLRSDGADPRTVSVPAELSSVDYRTFAMNGISIGEEQDFRERSSGMHLSCILTIRRRSISGHATGNCSAPLKIRMRCTPPSAAC